jgi:hypothetical protein
MPCLTVTPSEVRSTVLLTTALWDGNELGASRLEYHVRAKGAPDTVAETPFASLHPHVHRTLVISCEGRTDLAPFTMTLPTMMPPYASNRPSSAASRCSMATHAPCWPLKPPCAAPLPTRWYANLLGGTRDAKLKRLGGTVAHHARTGQPAEAGPCASLESEAPYPDHAYALILGTTRSRRVMAIRLAEERGGPLRHQVCCRA